MNPCFSWPPSRSALEPSRHALKASSMRASLSACFWLPLGLHSACTRPALASLSSWSPACLSACSPAYLSAASRLPLGPSRLPLGLLSSPFWSALKPLSAKSVASLSVCVTFLHVRLLCSSFRRSPEWLRPGYQRMQKSQKTCAFDVIALVAHQQHLVSSESRWPFCNQNTGARVGRHARV